MQKDSMKELQKERLNAKKKEIVSRQNALEIYWQNNKDKPLVEKNAINELLILMQLKSEVEELEKNIIKAETHQKKHQKHSCKK